MRMSRWGIVLVLSVPSKLPVVSSSPVLLTITFFTASLAPAIVRYGITVNIELSAVGSSELVLLKQLYSGLGHRLSYNCLQGGSASMRHCAF